MSNSSSGAAQRSPNGAAGSSFRTSFAGYYPPTEEDLRRFVADGLVVLDTNAVLDLYRFTDTTREQYLQTLKLLGDRLWIPNRVGEEFHDRRTDVIRERHGARDEINAGLAAPIAVMAAGIAKHAQRRGLDGQAVVERFGQSMRDIVETVVQDFEDAVGDIVLDPGAHPDADPILEQICALFDAKVGDPYDDKGLANAHQLHKIRLNAKIPPGYGDESKGDRSIGDYLVWRQAIDQAKKRKLPVLLVSNEKKKDWVFRDGEYIVPRPELVREMRKEADQDFHLVDVQTFLTLAKKYLHADVSDATVDEAIRLSDTSTPTGDVVRMPPARATAGAVPPTIRVGSGTASFAAINLDAFDWVHNYWADEIKRTFDSFKQQQYSSAFEGVIISADLNNQLMGQHKITALPPTVALSPVAEKYTVSEAMAVKESILNPTSKKTAAAKKSSTKRTPAKKSGTKKQEN